ncbi:hypothetical protein ACFE04_031171 [Oxalis oulophora]
MKEFLTRSLSWIIFELVALLLATSPTRSIFSSCSSLMRQHFGINPIQLNYLIVASEAGRVFGYFLSVATVNCLSPFIILLIGLLFRFIGHGEQYLCMIYHVNLSYWQLLLLHFLAGNSFSWINTYGSLLASKNFKNDGMSHIFPMASSYAWLTGKMYAILIEFIQGKEDNSQREHCLTHMLLNCLAPTLIGAAIQLIFMFAEKGDEEVNMLPIIVIIIGSGFYIAFENFVAPFTQMSPQLRLTVIVLVITIPLVMIIMIATELKELEKWWHFDSKSKCGMNEPECVEGINNEKEIKKWPLSSSIICDVIEFTCEEVITKEEDMKKWRNSDSICCAKDFACEEGITNEEVKKWRNSDSICYTKEFACKVITINNDEEEFKKGELKIENENCATVMSMEFWLFYLVNACGATLGVVYMNNLDHICTSYGNCQEDSSLMEMPAAFGFLGSMTAAIFIWCTRESALSYKSTTMAAILIILMIPMPIAFFILIINNGSTICFYISTAIIGTCSGAMSCMTTPTISQMFGPEYSVISQTIFLTNYPIGTLIFGYLAALNQEVTNVTTNRDYTRNFMLWEFISLVGTILSLCLFLWIRFVSRRD